MITDLLITIITEDIEKCGVNLNTSSRKQSKSVSKRKVIQVECNSRKIRYGHLLVGRKLWTEIKRKQQICEGLRQWSSTVVMSKLMKIKNIRKYTEDTEDQ